MRGRAGPFAHTHVEPGGSALQPTGCRHRATNLEGQSEPGPRMSAAAAAGRSVRSLPRGTDAGTLTLYSCLRLYQGGKSDETVCHDGHGRAHRDWGVCALCECRQLEQPKADIQAGNGFCGADVAALPVVGFTNYHRTGNTVSIEYHLKNALPDSTYIVELWGDACTFFGVITTVTTNGNGVANGNGDITVPAASTRFFATAWGPTAGTTPPL
jgi:hypothetical protein